MGEAPPFDPCECIFSPQAAMRRLISLLRNSQSFCTDEQCFGSPPGPSNTSDTGMTTFYLAIAWVVFALVLFMMRPRSMKDNDKRLPDQDHHDRNPPAPPDMWDAKWTMKSSGFRKDIFNFCYKFSTHVFIHIMKVK